MHGVPRCCDAMSDPALLEVSGYDRLQEGAFARVVRRVCQGVVAQTKNGVVHRVLHVGIPHGCEQGQWRWLILACGQEMKHHPKKLDRSATGAVTCLGCVGFSK